jgi:hypothetical protein
MSVRGIIGGLRWGLGKLGRLRGGRKVVADCSNSSEAHGLCISDAAEEDWVPSVEPRAGLVEGGFQNLMVSVASVEDEVVAVENFLAAVVESGGFAEKLEVACALVGGRVEPMMGGIADFPNLADMLPDGGGDCQDPR